MDVTPQSPPRRGFGCLGYGCLVSILILTVVLAMIGAFLLWSVRGAVSLYSTAQPPPFAVAPIEPTALAGAEAALKQMRELLDNPRGEGSVTLSSAQMLAASRLISDNRAEIVLDGTAFHARFSFPLAMLYGHVERRYGAAGPGRLILGDLIDRWVYGSATGTISLKDKVVEVQLSELELSGNKEEDQALVRASEWVSECVTSMLSGESEPPASGDAVIARLSELALRDGGLTVSFHPQP